MPSRNRREVRRASTGRSPCIATPETPLMVRALKALAAFAAFHVSLLGAGVAIAASVAPLRLGQIVAGAKQIVHVRCTGNVV